MADLSFGSLVEGKPVRIDKDGHAICVARVDGNVYAIDDTCSHSDASLAEGDIEGFKIECWLHGAHFDLRTGEALSLPAVQPVKSYSVRVDGDSVTVEI